MKHRLSKRLRAVASFVPAGCRLVDIGTDHALLPVTLLEEQHITRAIAMDVRQGPLERARCTVEEMDAEVGLAVELRLSDGFAALRENEADCAVIAGMGGALTCRILEAADLDALQITTLILEPQSEVEDVRRFLQERHMDITEEVMVEEGGKFYPVLKIEPHAETDAYADALNALTADGMERECAERILFQYGPKLMRKKDPVLREFLHSECARMQEALYRAKDAATESDHVRTLKEMYMDATKALRYTGGADAV